MKNKGNTKNTEYWLALSEKYFDAMTTGEEEKALAQFLASDAACDPTFDEIKAVMGYLSTGRSIAKKAKEKKRRTIGKVVQWTSIAACVAIIVVIGTSIKQQETQVEAANGNNDVYYACIDGKEYTNEEFVMEQMLATMNKMSNTSDYVIEEQMEAMFRINK